MKKFFFTLMTCLVLVSFTYCVRLKNVYRISKQTAIDENCDKNTAHHSGTPSMSAILMECPKRKTRKSDIVNCEQKVLVNVRVAPSEKVEDFEKYLLVDELYDPQKKSRAKLMEPYLIEVTRGEPVLMYPLEIVKSLQCASCKKNNMNNHKIKKDLTSIDYEDDDYVINADDGEEEYNNENNEINSLHGDDSLEHEKHIVRRGNDYTDDESLNYDKSNFENIFEELDYNENEIKSDIANYMQSKLTDDGLNDALEFDNDFNNNNDNFHEAYVYQKENHNPDIDPYCYCPCAQCTSLHGEKKCDCCGTCICLNGVCDIQHGTHKEQVFLQDNWPNIGGKQKENDNSEILSDEPLEKDVFNYDSIINDYESNKMLRESNEADFNNYKPDHIQTMSNNNQYISQDNSNFQASNQKQNDQFSPSISSRNSYKAPDLELGNNINSVFDYRSNNVGFDYDTQNIERRPFTQTEQRQLQQPLYGNIMDSNFRQNLKSEFSTFNKNNNNNNNNNNNDQHTNNADDYDRSNNINIGSIQEGNEREPQNVYEYVKRRNKIIYGMRNGNQNQNIKTSHQIDNNEIVPMNSDRIKANDEYDTENLYQANGGLMNNNNPNLDMRLNPPASNYNFHINFVQPKLDGSNMDTSQQSQRTENGNTKNFQTTNNYKSMQSDPIQENYKTYDNPSGTYSVSGNQYQRKINNNNNNLQQSYRQSYSTNNEEYLAENENNDKNNKHNRDLESPMSNSQGTQQSAIDANQSMIYQQQGEQLKENQQKQQQQQIAQHQPQQVPVKQQQGAYLHSQPPLQQLKSNTEQQGQIQATQCICSAGICHCNGEAQPYYHQNNDIKSGSQTMEKINKNNYNNNVNNNKNNVRLENSNSGTNQQINNIDPASDNHIPATSKLSTNYKEEQNPNQIINENEKQNKNGNGLNENVNNQQIPLNNIKTNLKQTNADMNNLNTVNNRNENEYKTNVKNDFSTNESNNNYQQQTHVNPENQQQGQPRQQQQLNQHNDARYSSQPNNENRFNSNTNRNYNNDNYNNINNNNNENFQNNNKNNMNSETMNIQNNQQHNPDTKNKYSASKGFPKMEVTKVNNNDNKNYNDLNEKSDDNDGNNTNLKEDNDDSSQSNSDKDDDDTNEDELSDWPEVLSPKKLPNAWPEVYRKIRNNNINNNDEIRNEIQIKKSNKIKKNINNNNGIKRIREKQRSFDDILEARIKKIQNEKYTFPSDDILYDRNLNTNDKMHLIDLLDNQRVNKELNDLEKTYDMSIAQNDKHIPENVIANHFYKRKVKQQHARELPSKNIAKRSYIFYDDLTFADTEREDDWENRFNELSPNFDEATNDDATDGGGDGHSKGQIFEHYEANDDNINNINENKVKKETIPKKLQSTKLKKLNSENIIDNSVERKPSNHQQEIEESDDLLDIPAGDKSIDENNSASLQSNNNNNANIDKKSTGKLQSSKIRRKMDDVWYTVYNMSAPLQFLTTRVRIFRKQANMWWKIAPTITLTSSSGIYANANLSIMFSSHTDIINLEHPLDPHKFKLLVPNTTNPLSKDFMTIDTSKLPIDDKNHTDDISKSICYAKYISNNNEDIDNDYLDNDKFKNLHRKREDNMGVHSLSDLGYFPSKLNIMEQCKDKPDHLCLNMLDEEVPAYKISVQFPFTQNALVYENFDFIRITRVIVDGTVAGVINIKVDLINMGFIGKDFIVFITKCPVTCGSNMVRKKHLSPYRNSDVVFNLPLQIMHERSSSLFSCEVNVENAKEFTVAHRSFSVKPFSRCFCIWNCMCICMGAIAKGQGQDCHTLSPGRSKPAGFNDNFMEHEAVFNWIALFQLIGLILLFFFLLGFLKGLLGICCKAIGRWKYNYLQPMNPFNEASFCKKFFINTIFFLVFPCVALCKCFTPTPDDLLESESTWERSFVQKEILTDEDDYNDDDYNEMSNLLNIVNESDKKSSVERLRAAGDSLSPETIFDSYNDEEEERDTGFVLTALTESRESLKMLDGHCSEDSTNNDAKYVEAADLVKRLRASKIVYRTLNRPLGHIDIQDNQQYSIRGYFIPTVGPGYQFITHIPLRQHWRINSDANSLSPIKPPLTLLPKDFTRSYVNKRAVLDAGDLYEHPSIHAPCVNVLIQDIAMYDIGDYDVENIGEIDDSDFRNDNNEQIVNNLSSNELPPTVVPDEDEKP